MTGAPLTRMHRNRSSRFGHERTWSNSILSFQFGSEIDHRTERSFTETRRTAPSRLFQISRCEPSAVKTHRLADSRGVGSAGTSKGARPSFSVESTQMTPSFLVAALYRMGAMERASGENAAVNLIQCEEEIRLQLLGRGDPLLQWMRRAKVVLQPRREKRAQARVSEG